MHVKNNKENRSNHNIVGDDGDDGNIFFFQGLVESMVQAAQPIISVWEGIIEQGEGNTVVITVDEYFRSYSADIICRKCFGSDYERGKQIYRKLKELSVKMAKSNIIFELPYLR